MDNHNPAWMQPARDLMTALIQENQQLKQHIHHLHERLQELAIRYDNLLELTIHTANHAQTQSPESWQAISLMLQSMIPPPECRTECPDDIDVESDDFLTVYEDTARLAAELFPDEPYFQPHQSE